jgi:hypothetical protein
VRLQNKMMWDRREGDHLKAQEPIRKYSLEQDFRFCGNTISSRRTDKSGPLVVNNNSLSVVKLKLLKTAESKQSLPTGNQT